jgi:methionyl-tRNA formyltransferase
MRHLVFTAKWVGARCVNYLLDTFPNDEYTFVVCEPDADMIVELLDRRGRASMRLGEDALNVIRSMEVGHFDWLLNLWGGYIFKEDTLSRARYTLNIHPAYLPYCRGRDPVVWAIRKGFPAGVTLHAITLGVDEGPVWHREKVPYELPVKGGDLYGRVAERSWKVFCEQWAKLRDGHVVVAVQSAPEGMHTFRRSDLLKDQRIDVDSDAAARDIVLRLLAHDFSPGYSSQVVIGGKVFNATLSLSPVDNSNSPLVRGQATQSSPNQV